MNQLVVDIWPYLMTALIGAIGYQFRESYLLKTKVAVLESDLENLQESVDKDIESIQKNIENIQKRQDSHSKKQDEILTLITDFKLEVVKQIGEMAADLRALNSTLSVYDDGAKFIKKGNKGK